jgi:hypothetical protein
MRRKSFDALVTAGGVMFTVVLVAAGILLYWGYSYANNSVTSQLAAQKITFPTKAEIALATNPPPGGFSEITPAMVRYLEPYAGQQLTTGAQAQVYANDFINIHLQEIGGGKTYAQLSAAAMALAPGTAAYNAAESKVTTIFQGTTLRGMLLNAFGWWQMGQIALLSSIAAFAGAVVAALLSVLGVRHFRRVPLEEEFPKFQTAQPVPVAADGRVPAHA